MPSKVFVGNLDFNATRADVQQLFAQVGEIKDVFLPMDRESGRPRGFAFVEYASDDDAAKAIEKFNGFTFSGRPLRVNAAEDRPRGPRTARPGGFGGGRPSGDSGGGYGGGDFYGGGDGGWNRDGGGGGDFGGGGGRGFGGGKSKGSRRNIRGKKRSL